MIKILFFLFSLLGLFYLVKKVLGYSSSQTPFLTICILMISLYISTWINALKIFSVLIYFTGLFYFFIFNIKKLYQVKRLNPELVLNKKFNPYLFFFIVTIINWVIFKNYLLYAWDEFSFWGIFTKIITEHNQLIHDFTWINKAEYPRGTSLIQYYFNLFLSKESYSEGITIFAQVTLITSALIPLVFWRHKPNLILLIFYVLAYFGLFYIFISPVYSIYNDNVLSIFWSMSIILYLFDQNATKGLLSAALVLFCLQLIKETGLIFSGITIVVIAINYFFFKARNRPVVSRIKHLSILIIVIVISKFSWSLYLDINNVKKDSFSIDLKEVIDFNYEDYQKFSIQNFKKSLLFSGNVKKENKKLKAESNNLFISEMGSPLKFKDKIDSYNLLFSTSYITPKTLIKIEYSLSPLAWYLLFLILALAVLLKKEVVIHLFGSFKSYITFLIVLTLSFIGYIILLEVLYLHSFVKHEAIRLASFGRYVGTMFLGMFIILFFVLIRSKNIILPIVFVLTCFSFTPGNALEVFVPYEKNPKTIKNNSEIEKLKIVANQIIELKTPVEKVLFINQRGKGSTFVKFKYTIFPLKSKGCSFHNLSKINARTKLMIERDFGSYLEEFEVVVLWDDFNLPNSFRKIIEERKIKTIDISK